MFLNYSHMLNEPLTIFSFFTEDLKTVVWDINTGNAIVQAPCTCLCFPNLYPDPTSRCQLLPCTNQCPAPPSAWRAALPLTSHFLTRNQVRITDPDSWDYGFDNVAFTLNLSCSSGLLFVNEYFLIGEQRCTSDSSLCRNNKDCSAVGQSEAGQCRTNPPVITPLPVPTGYQTGLNANPMQFGIGNKFLSLSGTMTNLNLALAALVYVGDLHFSTMLQSEAIVGLVDDNGAMSSSADVGLKHPFVIDTLVKPVNNPVQIGMMPGSVLLPLNDSINALCFSIPPSGEEYSTICGPKYRHYIDIDEDTPFTITPDILWINDVDSQEAVVLAQRSKLQYACSDPTSENYCTCYQVCRCGELACSCEQPAACDTTDLPPGLLLIEMSVQHGMLTLQPPPGRSQVPVTFMQQVTQEPIGECLTRLGSIIYEKLAECFTPCSDQVSCAINRSSLLFTIDVIQMQNVLTQKYLTYRANQYYYGPDSLTIWAIDQGYTDYSYSYVRSIADATQQTIAIRVVGVNNPPVISYPKYVLRYQGNQPCYVDYMEFSTAINCPYVTDNPQFYNYSSIPPLQGPQQATALSFPEVPYITISDVDMDGTIYGNMTLVIQIGAIGTGYAGRFTISEAHQFVEHFQYFNPIENRGYLELDGKMQYINVLMRRIYFDPNPSFQGICSFYLKAFDNNNFGECDGDHECGLDFPCDNGLEAAPHKPSVTGEGQVVIDVISGGSSLCVASTCKDCIQLSGCGWCHSTCNGAGKCMIGAGAPSFESCPLNSSINFAYGQCGVNTGSLLPVIAAAIAVFMIFLSFMIYCARFISRRYGSLTSYVKKLQVNMAMLTSKLKLGNAGQGWEFRVGVLVCIIPLVFVTERILSVSNNPACDYNQEFFLDTATQLVLDVDYCNIRYVPPTLFSSPSDSQITAMKLKFALLEDPSIVLDANTCEPGGGVTITVQNSRPLNIRYKNYYCNILLLIPDKFVIPSTYIRDMNGFATNIRSGSMDADTPNFALNFGPSTFSVEGAYMNVRLRGVNTKNFIYEATSGQLFAEDVIAVTASATSVDADLAMTSPTQTSVSFWQKDGDKVCLTAANGSLYVDNSCSSKCQYLPVQTINYTNISASSLTEANCSLPTVWGTWQATASPPTCELYCPDLKRPIIPGCVDQTTCVVSGTPQCLCKPYCDMIPANQLSYAGVSGLSGTCNTAGQCCRTICAGFARADMFPDANEPRNGIEAAGTAKPWTPNNLAQKWVFSSNSGVISFQVLTPGVLASNSWKGGALSPSIDLEPAPTTRDLDALDHLFHPGGANSPKVDKFYLLLTGPGTPEVINGHFEWVTDVKYLMVSPWLLRVVSFGLLTPTIISSTESLSSGFCPNVAPDELTFDTRLIRMYSLLADALQNYPAGQPAKPLPEGSFITFINLTGPAIIFYKDEQTGEVRLTAFDPAEHLHLTLITAFALLMPFLVAICFTLVLIFVWRRFILQRRKEIEEEASLMRNGLIGNLENQEHEKELQESRRELELQLRDDSLTPAQATTLRNRLLEVQVEQRMHREMSRKIPTPTRRMRELAIAKTGFFDLYEELEGNFDSRDFLTDLFLIVREVVIALGPSAVPLYGAFLLQIALLDDQCAFAVDQCACYGTPFPIVQSVTGVVMTFWVVCGVELGFHYLGLGYSMLQQMVRYIFYPLYFALLGISFFILCTVVTWIILGVLIFTTQMLPYASATVGLITVAALKQMTLSDFQQRLAGRLRARTTGGCEDAEPARRLRRLLRPELFELFLRRQIQQAYFLSHVCKTLTSSVCAIK